MIMLNYYLMAHFIGNLQHEIASARGVCLHSPDKNLLSRHSANINLILHSFIDFIFIKVDIIHLSEKSK